MGVLTDFVVAGADEARRVGESPNPSRDFAGIDAKGIGQVQMGTLYSILSETAYDPAFMLAEESFAYSASDDGPWVQRVPDDMVKSLARMTDEGLARVAERWSQTGEFEPRYSNWSRDDIARFLRQMRDLSAHTAAQGKAVFMWTSL